MPKTRCKPCMSPGIKNAIRDYNKSPEVLRQLDKIPDCEEGELNICECKAGREGRVKREPSAYNRFIGECMRSKHITGFGNAAPAMKDCAGEWRKEHPKK